MGEFGMGNLECFAGVGWHGEAVLHSSSGQRTSLQRCIELQVRQLARVVMGKQKRFAAMRPEGG